MLRVSNIRTEVPMRKTVAALVAKKIRCRVQDIEEVRIVRRSVDARRKPKVYLVFTADIIVRQEARIWRGCRDNKDIKMVTEAPAIAAARGNLPLRQRPIVVGTGPAGLAAAFMLAQYGFAPLVLERGQDVETRTACVEKFRHEGILCEHTNVQFGEGGAGTFSDGKLTTRVNHPLIRNILHILVKAGAPEEILYTYNPHVGTDRLRQVVKNLRHMIMEAGGDVRFASCVTDIICNDRGQVQSVVVNHKEQYDTSVLLLGIGHSARDTYEMLHRHGMAMVFKPFAVGVRIEHEQHVIDRGQYGNTASALGLEPASYALAYHCPDGRSCYSFCMCPGGEVVAAASEAGGVVTNGMSVYARNSGAANSALVVNVTERDIRGTDPLRGIAFQRRYEQLAYAAGGHNYKAPAQTVGDFLRIAAVSPGIHTYMPGVTWTDLSAILPAFVTQTLQEALPYFERKIKGFAAPQVVLTGVETRTSAPVRLLRDENRMSVGTAGLYPIGEGAGYAGGIMSAFLDGMETALTIIRKFKPLEVQVDG